MTKKILIVLTLTHKVKDQAEADHLARIILNDIDSLKTNSTDASIEILTEKDELDEYTNLIFNDKYDSKRAKELKDYLTSRKYTGPSTGILDSELAKADLDVRLKKI